MFSRCTHMACVWGCSVCSSQVVGHAFAQAKAAELACELTEVWRSEI
jgi:hypothetical protein